MKENSVDLANTHGQAVVLLILDGFGMNPDHRYNAVYQANTPFFDSLMQNYPHTLLNASGPAVGLPEGQMGNSEVGHLTIGAGAILKQDLVRIDEDIRNGEFFYNPVLLKAIEQSRQQRGVIHLLGLVSPGGVHSHINHLCALIQLCKKQNIKPVVHCITDGRDTPPQSALNSIEIIEQELNSAGGLIATISGRYYSMDRDKRWDRTRLAWEALCYGHGEMAASAAEAIKNAYKNNIGDEFIKPTVIHPEYTIDVTDPIIFFNFRNDRTRQLTYLLASQDFKPFDRGDFIPRQLICLTEYDPELNIPIVYAPEFPRATLASVISDAGIEQFHCAETEKYAHVTFFLNGGREEPYPGERRILIPSPDVATYDLKPEMSADQVADALIEAMKARRFGFIVANFANGDMVGHTARQDAIIKAVETLDTQIKRVIEYARSINYSVLLTADHGNCDQMVDYNTGEPHTQHTMNPVPCILITSEVYHLTDNSGLCNIAPTILQLMGLDKPDVMNCKSLLQSSDNAQKI